MKSRIEHLEQEKVSFYSQEEIWKRQVADVAAQNNILIGKLSNLQNDARSREVHSRILFHENSFIDTEYDPIS